MAAQLHDWYGDDVPEYAREENHYLWHLLVETFPGDGWTITTGSASYNEGSGTEMMIGNDGFALDSEDIKLETWV